LYFAYNSNSPNFKNLSYKEDPMAKKKGNYVSFDAMVKFFIKYYNIPTRKDIDKLMTKMDRLEMLI